MDSIVSNREDNLGFLRLAGAIFVFTGHMGMIWGENYSVFAGFHLHELGVILLFALGGYYITNSWLSDKNIFRYFIRRFFRFYPPYAVMIFLMVFVAGPLLSDLGWKGYFSSWYTLYLKNLRFYITYSQPGVFSDIPVSSTTNGAIWTFPAEALFYLITPLLLTILKAGRDRKDSFRDMACFTVLLVGLDIFFRIAFPDGQMVIYGSNLLSVYHLLVIFVIGMLYTYDEMKRVLNLQAGMIALCLMTVFQIAPDGIKYIWLYILFPYAIFSFALEVRPVFSRIEKKVKLSYGIYLYGFFFQQLTIFIREKTGLEYGYYSAFAISLFMTIVAALFSFYCIEKPFLKLGRIILNKIK